MVNGTKYCIPLSSNSSKKNKNLNYMRENITLCKIRDKDGKILAVLNLNNMIPIQDDYIKEIYLKIKPSDSAPTKKWRHWLCP